VASLVIALALGAGGFGLIRPLTDQIMWQPYTEAAFAKARASGNVVMVEFTAFWCGNCQALEATVFHDSRVREAIARAGVVTLRADMTSENPEAKKLLLQLSSAGGIPLTAIYGPRQNRPIQLSSVYASENLVQAIGRASPAAK
jgi:thiol:disulfide interchange protein DsbD